MKITTISDRIHLSDELGTVSCEVVSSENPIAVITLAHGAGAGMNHSFMVQLANALAQRGISSVRYNFPFTELKKKRPDRADVAMATVSAAYQYAKKHNPKLPLFLSGKSFGGRMSSQWLATESFPSIKGLICFGFPLHPAGKPSIIRAAHLPQIKFPMLFLQGTKDALADLTLLQSVLNDIPNATLITFDKANHGFQIGKRDVIEELAEATALWIRAQLKLK